MQAIFCHSLFCTQTPLASRHPHPGRLPENSPKTAGKARRCDPGRRGRRGGRGKDRERACVRKGKAIPGRACSGFCLPLARQSPSADRCQSRPASAQSQPATGAPQSQGSALQRSLGPVCAGPPAAKPAFQGKGAWSWRCSTGQRSRCSGRIRAWSPKLAWLTAAKPARVLGAAGRSMLPLTLCRTGRKRIPAG